MKSAAIKTVTGFFLVYFVLGSLVFLGQDLTVRRTADNSWCISLAVHSHDDAWSSHSPDTRAFSNPGEHCSHKHKSGEVHICVEHHKFLASWDSIDTPQNDLQKSSLLIDDSISESINPYLYPDHYNLPGHDPGPDRQSLLSASIMLL